MRRFLMMAVLMSLTGAPLTAQTPPPSPDTVTDAAGRVWTLGATPNADGNLPTLRDGEHVGGGYVSEYRLVNGVVLGNAVGIGWHKWTGSVWERVADPPALPDPGPPVPVIPIEFTVTEKWEIVKGDSAYQVAVNNGFVGSQADWLNSLRGPIGIAVEGPMGPPGRNYAPRYATETRKVSGSDLFQIAAPREGFVTEVLFVEFQSATKNLRARIMVGTLPNCEGTPAQMGVNVDLNKSTVLAGRAVPEGLYVCVQVLGTGSVSYTHGVRRALPPVGVFE